MAGSGSGYNAEQHALSSSSPPFAQARWRGGGGQNRANICLDASITRKELKGRRE
jgi:hypothetical protein